MASSPKIQHASQGRANAMALGLLCGLMAVETGLMIRALNLSQSRPNATPPVAKAEPSPTNPVSAVENKPSPILTAPPVSISPPPVGQLAAPAAIPTIPSPPVTVGFGPPPIGSLQLPGNTPPAVAQPAPTTTPAPAMPSKPAAGPPQTNIASPAKAVPGKPEAADPAAGMTLPEMIDLAKQVRSLGDMQGALEVLKRADLQFPASPEIIAETATSYESMGLADKATSLWKQLAAMESARAGGYGDLAKRKLNISSATAGGSAPAFSGDFGPKMLSLGACTATRDPSTVNGEKVVLRIPILRNGSATIDPAQVDIDVYFFDRVNGEKVAQTIADEPLSAWGAAPVDWSGIGEEPLDVTYFLPTLTPGEVAAHGRRAYHGYVVRLYYQHKLQDVAAEPRDLLDYGQPAPQTMPGGGMNPLLPPVSN